MLQFSPFHPVAIIASVSGTLLSLMLLTTSAGVLAHAGHGDEFKAGSEATQTADIKVDAETAKRMGIKVEPVKRQQLSVGIKTTGQIETLPNQKVEVTSPVDGTVVELQVKPGDKVRQGQPVAVLSSSELAQLRVESLSKQAEAQADIQKAQADLNLATGNYQRQLQISAAEITQAQTQLVAAQKQYERDQSLVNQGALVAVARENYQRQIQISQAEIAQANTELTVAKEQYERDLSLVASGALPRRQMLESKAHLAEGQTQVARAKQRQNVLQAQTELKRAEAELPLRELRESQGKLAEAKAQLTKANSRREVLEASAQLKRAQSDIQASQSRLRLASSAYQTRLQQLGTIANDKGLVSVVAPISGIVADREITPRESVKASDKPLMTILNDSSVFATANIYEKDLNQVKKNQQVQVKVASLKERTFTGRIAVIGSVVEGETRVVGVKTALDNSEGLLKPGMFVELEVLTGQTANTSLVIPNSAVVDANGKKTVYIQNGNAFQASVVTLGQTSGDMVEVKSGLFEGDLIVTQRAPQLYAQSLRGGTTASVDEHQEAPTDVTVSKTTNSFAPPWWLVLPVGGVVAGGTFWAGTFWATRRTQRRMEPVVHSESEATAYETQADLKNFKQPTLSGLTRRIDKQEDLNNLADR